MRISVQLKNNAIDIASNSSASRCFQAATAGLDTVNRPAITDQQHRWMYPQLLLLYAEKHKAVISVDGGHPVLTLNGFLQHRQEERRQQFQVCYSEDPDRSLLALFDPLFRSHRLLPSGSSADAAAAAPVGYTGVLSGVRSEDWLS